MEKHTATMVLIGTFKSLMVALMCFMFLFFRFGFDPLLTKKILFFFLDNIFNIDFPKYLFPPRMSIFTLINFI